MIYKKFKDDNKIIYKYEFDSLNELATYIENTPVNKKCFLRLASVDIDYNYSGTHSFEEALNLCKYGVDKEKVDSFIKTCNMLDTKLPDLTKDRKTEDNVYGMRPNIVNYLRSNPRSMYSLKRFKPKGVIDVYYNVSTRYTTSLKQIETRGICTIELVKLLENLGYTVSLNLISSSYEEHEYTYISVKIKDDSEYIDPLTCYFPMCHSSYPRRIIFRMKETIQYEDIYEKYGIQVDPDFVLNNSFGNKIFIPNEDIFSNQAENIVDSFFKLCEKININDYLNKEEKLDIDNNEKILVIRR